MANGIVENAFMLNISKQIKGGRRMTIGCKRKGLASIPENMFGAHLIH